MQIILTSKEQDRLIDIAKSEGINSVKEFQMWMQEHRHLMIELFSPNIYVDYSSYD